MLVRIVTASQSVGNLTYSTLRFTVLHVDSDFFLNVNSSMAYLI